jgi:hypothetical protein
VPGRRSIAAELGRRRGGVTSHVTCSRIARSRDDDTTRSRVHAPLRNADGVDIDIDIDGDGDGGTDDDSDGGDSGSDGSSPARPLAALSDDRSDDTKKRICCSTKALAADSLSRGRRLRCDCTHQRRRQAW